MEREKFTDIILQDPLGITPALFQVPDRYTDLKLIGAGAQGIVCSATDSETNEKVAIKKLTRPFVNLLTAKRTFREIQLMKQFEHPNVIKLWDIFTPQTNVADFNDIYIVMEFMDDTLNHIESTTITPEQISFLLYQLLCGVKYMHSAGILHRDLKSSNVVINKQCQLKILDFGLARCQCLDENNPARQTPYVVSRHYRAPEVIVGLQYTEKIDVWSIGCIFGELLLGKVLFPGEDQVNQWDVIIEKLGTPTNLLDQLEPSVRMFVETRGSQKGLSFQELFPDSCFRQGPDTPDDLKAASGRDLLTEMLNMDPFSRIHVHQALQHPYVKQWTRDDEVNSEPPQRYDDVIDDVECSLEQWKALLFESIGKIRYYG